MNITETVSANIRRELAARKWTQRDLATRTGMPDSRISELLTGKYEPSIGKLEKVAKAFGINTSVLLMPVPEEISSFVD